MKRGFALPQDGTSIADHHQVADTVCWQIECLGRRFPEDTIELLTRLACSMLTSVPWSGCLTTTSVAETTRSRSPGVSSAAFRAQSPNLRFAPLVDMALAVSCPLVRYWRLISGFLFIDSHV